MIFGTVYDGDMHAESTHAIDHSRPGLTGVVPIRVPPTWGKHAVFKDDRRERIGTSSAGWSMDGSRMVLADAPPDTAFVDLICDPENEYGYFDLPVTVLRDVTQFGA